METVNKLNGNHDNLRALSLTCCGSWELRPDCGIGGHTFGGSEADSECV